MRASSRARQLNASISVAVKPAAKARWRISSKNACRRVTSGLGFSMAGIKHKEEGTAAVHAAGREDGLQLRESSSGRRFFDTFDAENFNEHLIFGVALVDDGHRPHRRIPMIKSQLIQIIASRNTHLFLRDVEVIVDAIFDEIVEVLGEGGRAELRGFGSFTVKHRPAHPSRNPQTGEAIDVEEKWVPAFRAGKGLRERMNGGE